MKRIICLNKFFFLCFWVLLFSLEKVESACNELSIASRCGLICIDPSSSYQSETIVTIPASNGTNHVGEPPTNRSQILRYIIEGVNGIPVEEATTMIHLFVNSGTTPGMTVQARVYYDWTSFDSAPYPPWNRIETFQKWALDVNPSTWEEYNYPSLADRFQSIIGEDYQTMVNGVIQIDIWQSSGLNTVPIQMKADNAPRNDDFSYIQIPYITSGLASSTQCHLDCPSSYTADACGVCDGPGITACDGVCFSTKVDDGCGVCGGPGPSGCDDICNSTKQFDSCGVCGGNKVCTAPDGTFSCSLLSVRNSCKKLMCKSRGIFDDHTSTTLVIPSSGGIRNVEQPPTDPKKIVTLLIDGINGFYMENRYTVINLWLDSLNVEGQAVAARVSYDFKGDGKWDRIELFKIFSPNDAPNFEKFSASAKPSELEEVSGNYADLENGTVRLELWSALETLFPLYLDTSSGISTVEIPFITAYQSGLDRCNQTEEKICNCVGFRLDDIQDWYVNSVQKAIIETFKEEDAPLTVGVIANALKEDKQLISFLKNEIQSTDWELEIACHGYNHEDFTRFPENEQFELISNSTVKIMKTLGITSVTTFIPPFNEFNSNTVTAIKKAGYTHLSASTVTDPRPYPEETNFKRIPMDAATNDLSNNDLFIHVPWETTFSSINDQMQQDGFSVVMLHPFEYAKLDSSQSIPYLNQIDPIKLNELKNLIRAVKKSGYDIIPLGNIGVNRSEKPIKPLEDEDKDEKRANSIPLIIGLSIGFVILCLIILSIIFFIRKKKSPST